MTSVLSTQGMLRQWYCYQENKPEKPYYMGFCKTFRKTHFLAIMKKVCFFV